MSKLTRQIHLYMYMDDPDNYEHSPERLMDYLGVSLRTLQRDFKDLRESGTSNYTYNSKSGEYVYSEEDATKIESADRRRKLYLTKLARMCRIVKKLPFTDLERLNEYEADLKDYLSERKKYPKRPDPYGPPKMPYIPDIKYEYFNICPEVSERTRQRDFQTLRDAGFVIFYSQRYREYLFTDDDSYITSKDSALYKALKKAGDIRKKRGS